MNASTFESAEASSPSNSYGAGASAICGDVVMPRCRKHADPSIVHLEQRMAAWEDASGALVFASGQQALAAIVDLIEPGQELIVSTDLDAGTCRVLSKLLWSRGVAVWCVDSDELADVVSERTSMVFVQVPGGSKVASPDLGAIAAAASEAGALLVVDATPAGPAVVKPLASGADVVLHTSDAILGASGTGLACVASTNSGVLAKLARFREFEDAAPDASDARVVLNGLTTIGLRSERQSATAARLARFLGVDPSVARVFHGGGPHVVFEPKEADVANTIVGLLQRFRSGQPFDGVTSAVSVTLATGCRGLPELDREPACGGPLIRLSVGLEPSDQLLADLSDALSEKSV